MDSNIKLPRPNLVSIFIAIFLGIIASIALYQAQVRGLIPGYNLNLPKVSTQETRVIVSEENDIIFAVEKGSPSVVAIGVSRNVLEGSTIGTGFIVSDGGIIVTNKHVVSDTGTKYMVITSDSQKYDVKRIYRDPILDLAVVQIDASGLQSLELGDSSKLKVGQTVIAIGNALGKFTNTVTTGVVSGLGRAVSAGDLFAGSTEKFDNLIQTDAAINPGNSGGPLLNSSGRVIGVSVATTEGAQNIGFAVPINSVKQIVDEFITKGSVSRSFLGISYKFISKDAAILNDIPQGVYIQAITDNSPAQKSGVHKGDIITSINGIKIDAEGKIAEIVAKSTIGTSLLLTIWREGKEIKLTAILSELPSE